MTKRIARSICLVSVAILTASLILIMGALYNYFSGVQMKQLGAQAEFVSKAVEVEGTEYLSRLDSNDYRVTWIAADGTVKFDSMAKTGSMENHLEREEIKEALKNGTGQSSRYSTTMTERQLYYARRLPDGTVLRVSCTQYTYLTLALGMSPFIIIVLAVAIVISFVIASRVSKSIVKPLNQLDLSSTKPSEMYPEIAPLSEKIKSQQRQLAAQRDELERKKNEFDAATANLSEGLVLLNASGVILSINKAASELLGISRYSVGKDLMLFNNSYDIQELLLCAGKGEHSEKIMHIGCTDYQFNVSPVVSGGKAVGAALIIFDITLREKAEQMRREFTANVSHELKTPLQSISGCAELLADGLVKSEDVPKFSEQIYSESKRMIALVNDIIGLSRLDEGSVNTEKSNIDLYRLAAETVKSLSGVAEGAGVSLELQGESSTVFGIEQLLGVIIFNLCDNAIKYNKKGGSVKVTVTDTPSASILDVSDTGIGIPEEQVERVFERFYRVDKSRSKSVGGTGLGLSIVKHAAKLHDADIKLKSKLGVGTSVTVTFPKVNPTET